MDLNTRGRYAVMAMADLAHNTDASDAVPLSAIAERQLISLAYLEQLFSRLRRAELVESVRGRGGGYRLARAAGTITVAEIMSAVDESTDMTRCGLEHQSPCLGGKRCLTHDLWDALSVHIEQFLSAITLKQVLDGSLARPSLTLNAGSAVFSGGVMDPARS